MKEYALTTRVKDLSLVKTIIKNEDLDAVASVTEDAFGNVWIGITADREDYEILRSVYKMVAC